MAIKALAWMVRTFEPPVYCYHEIVHNKIVVDRFVEQGVVFVDDIADVPPGRRSCCRRTARHPKSSLPHAPEGSYVVDSVCPLVTKVHHEVKVRAKKGYRIVYVGHEGHEEAVGTMAVAPTVDQPRRERRRGRGAAAVRSSRSRCWPRPRCRTAIGQASPTRSPPSTPTHGRRAAATCASPPPTGSRR